MASLNDTIAALDRLPALPATSMRLISMLAGGGRDADLREVESIISHDEAVTAAVLRRANSAAFGMRGRVAGLSDAVRRLGDLDEDGFADFLLSVGGDGIDHPGAVVVYGG